MIIYKCKETNAEFVVLKIIMKNKESFAAIRFRSLVNKSIHKLQNLPYVLIIQIHLF
jgi:hypothetical protein